MAGCENMKLGTVEGVSIYAESLDDQLIIYTEAGYYA
jgi:hypothetical protein